MNERVAFIIIFFLCNYFAFSQNWEKINNSNTVFIYFNDSMKEQKRIIKATNETIEDKKPELYQFFFYGKKGLLKSTPLTFNYVNWSSKDEPIRFRLHKSFLRKNKDIIITQYFMYKIGDAKMIKLLNKAKTIFLIDKSDIRDRKILVKQVYYVDMLVI